MRNKIILFFVLTIAIFAAISFLPSLLNDFVNWDDNEYLLKNPLVRDLSFGGIKRLFTANIGGTYSPLVLFSYAVEYRFFGFNPFVYHLTNYLLNMLTTALVFYFIYLLGGSAKTAFLTGLLFGVHPLHVESVAWVAERKDVLFAVFYMTTLILYLCYSKRGKTVYYIACLAAAALALLSKITAATLPVVFILIDYFYRRKTDRKSILEKTPFFVLAIIFIIVNINFQIYVGATRRGIDMLNRIYFILKAFFLYIEKTFFPINLSAVYPFPISMPPAGAKEIAPYLIFAAGVSALAIFLIRAYSRKAMFGLGFFLIGIMPALLMIPLGHSYAADRYMYLPSIGIFYIFSVAIDDLLQRPSIKAGNMKFAVYALILICVFALAKTSWHRCRVWKDTANLFSDVIKKYPEFPLSYKKVGLVFMEKGDFGKAIPYFRRALAIYPGFESVKKCMRDAYMLKEKMSGRKTAGDKLKPAVVEEKKSRPQKEIVVDVELLNKLGVQKGMVGELDAAISLFKEASRLDPNHAETYNNLGYAYWKKGDPEKAEEYFNKAIEADPDHKKAQMNLRTLREMRK